MFGGNAENQSGLLLSKNSCHRMLDTAGMFVAAICRNEAGSAVSSTFASSILAVRSVDLLYNECHCSLTYALGSCRSAIGATVMVGVGTTAPNAHCAPSPIAMHRTALVLPSRYMNEWLIWWFGQEKRAMVFVKSSKVVIVMCTCWTASGERKPCPLTAPSNLSGQNNPCSVVHVHFVERQKPTDQHPLHDPNAVAGDGDQGSTTPVVLDGSSLPLTIRPMSSHSLIIDISVPRSCFLPLSINIMHVHSM